MFPCGSEGICHGLVRMIKKKIKHPIPADNGMHNKAAGYTDGGIYYDLQKSSWTCTKTVKTSEVSLGVSLLIDLFNY